MRYRTGGGDSSHRAAAWGQVRVSEALKRRGLSISPAGVRCVWQRPDLTSMKHRLKELEAKVAQEGILLTEAQITALDLPTARRHSLPGASGSAAIGAVRRKLLRRGDTVSSRSGMGAHGRDRQKASTGGVTRSSVEPNPRSSRDRRFESRPLQRGVCLCGELRGCGRKASRLCASLHRKRDERGKRVGSMPAHLAVSL